jgi:single-strand DNA-binding protein
MLIANIYGRLAADPTERTAKSGNPMATASIAVDVAGRDSEPTTLWVGILAFGVQAEALLRASKGEMLAAMGRLTRGSYTAKDGTERERWTLIADSVVTAKSARPGARRKDTQPQRNEAKADQTPLNDPLGF